MSASQIRPIEQESVQRIVAGQAVHDLASAVKELVDNSLDAGSKSINIRLFNQGIDIVEVSDDGCGIPLASRPFAATAHATSKIRSFQDIYQGSEALTMGFRGEALFCLSNLSTNLVVATRTADQEHAQKLEFRRDGSLNPESVATIPRKVGTTVAVVGLLQALPVRRADMIRRISNQRGRLMRLMTGYGIFSVGVRINLMDMVMSGGSCRETTLLATSLNSSSIQETISSVLGSKFLASLCPLSVDLTSAVAGGNDAANVDSESEGNTDTPVWKMEGLVAKAMYSRDRGTRDGQFFSINGRPVDIPKVAKLLNEVWRTFGGQKRPSCVLKFTLPNNAFDINLSPDKRQVLLTYETEICALVQEGITKLWASQTEGQFTAHSISDLQPVSQAERDQDAHEVSRPNAESPGRFNRRYAFAHDFSNAKMQHEYDDGRTARRQFQRRSGSDDVLPATETTQEPVSLQSTTEEKKQEAVDQSEEPEPVRTQLTIDPDADSAEKACATDHVSVTPSPGNAVGVDAREGVRTSQADQATDADRHGWKRAQQTFNSPGSKGLEEEIETVQRMDFDRFRASGDGGLDDTSVAVPAATGKTPSLEQFGFQVTRTEQRSKKRPPATKRASSITEQESERSSKRPRRHEARSESAAVEAEDCADTEDAELSHERTVDAEPAQHHAASKQAEKIPTQPDQAIQQSSSTVVWDSFTGTNDVIQSARRERLAMRDRKRQFQTTASSSASSGEVPTGEGNATGDTISLSKDDFNSITVIGQFNLGFILARSKDNHLWILDQHACDEKYNFEKLYAETVIHEQTLIAPMPLELSPSEETCVLDHMDIFVKNGFRFAYDPDKPPRHRFALTALPHSGARDGRKAVQFGKEDVSALCAILGADGSASSYDGAAGSGTGADGSGLYGNNAVRRYAGAGAGETTDKIIARLPKAIAMFASRACRGSIMIGKALSTKEMDKIVKRLAGVEHPWNCPHGRPTMRHVGNVAHLMLEDERKAAEQVAGPTVTVLSQEEAPDIDDE